MSTVIFSRSKESRADDSDGDDEASLLRPAIPIAEGDVGDISVPPGDGLEYLRRVRRQQQALPAVVHARIDPERLRQAEMKAAARPLAPGCASRGSTMAAFAVAASATPQSVPRALLPRKAWQRQLLAEFAAASSRLQQDLQRGGRGGSNAATHAMPDSGDALGWANWCRGRPPKMPLVRALDQPRALGLLRGVLLAVERSLHADCPAHDTSAQEGVACAYDEAPSHARDAEAPNDVVCQWAFAVLARLDRHQLDAEACASVRALFVASTALRARLAAPGRAPLMEGESARQAASLNVLITLCGGAFGQAPPEEWEGRADDEAP